MRVFLDTNVLVSAFSTRGFSSDVFRLVPAEHEMMTGEVNLRGSDASCETGFACPGRLEAIEQLLREHTIPQTRGIA